MKVLVAGIGNIFMGDDGFGVEVAQRMVRRVQPDGVVVRDLGIRGLALSFELEEPWDAVLLIDVAQRGGPPGTLYVLEPDPASLGKDGAGALADGLHGMNPDRVLAMVGVRAKLLIVACEPATFGDLEHDDPAMGLSEPVAAAVEPAIELIGSVIARLGEAGAHA